MTSQAASLAQMCAPGDLWPWRASDRILMPAAEGVRRRVVAWPGESIYMYIVLPFNTRL